MKLPSLSNDVLPIAEFKSNAAQVLRNLNKSHRPVVITQNGKAAAVLISPSEFDRLAEKVSFVQSVAEGLADSDAGRVIGDDELTEELEREGLA